MHKPEDWPAQADEHRGFLFCTPRPESWWSPRHVSQYLAVPRSTARRRSEWCWTGCRPKASLHKREIEMRCVLFNQQLAFQQQCFGNSIYPVMKCMLHELSSVHIAREKGSIKERSNTSRWGQNGLTFVLVDDARQCQHCSADHFRWARKSRQDHIYVARQHICNTEFTHS